MQLHLEHDQRKHPAFFDTQDVERKRSGRKGTTFRAKKALFVSSDPVTPLISNSELVYTSVDPVADNVGFTLGASAETRERL